MKKKEGIFSIRFSKKTREENEERFSIKVSSGNEEEEEEEK